VLEVIEHQEQSLVFQVGMQRLSRSLPFCLAHAQRPGDGRNHETRVCERRQGEEHYSIREKVSGIPGRPDGQTRLADAASTGEREQLDLRLSK
jgi:hypothetical protein